MNPNDKNLSVAARLTFEADNADYWLQKAIELLREVQLTKVNKIIYEESLSQATFLLTLCRYKNDANNKGRTQTRNKTSKRTDKVPEGT